MDDRRDAVEPFPRQRLGTVDYMRVAARRSDVHGLVELDVTEARALIDDHESETGERPSFTAFLVHCLAAALDEHPDLNAYRDWRGLVVSFAEVDVNVMVETTVDGDRLGVPTWSTPPTSGRYGRFTTRSARPSGTRTRAG